MRPEVAKLRIQEEDERETNVEMQRMKVEVLVCASLGVDSLVLKCNGIMEEAPRIAQPFFLSPNDTGEKQGPL